MGAQVWSGKCMAHLLQHTGVHSRDTFSVSIVRAWKRYSHVALPLEHVGTVIRAHRCIL